jgi:transcriptional regulator with XRE-family HTH domain
MDLKRAMATNVRRARHVRELTQEELADRARLSARYLGSIERGAVSASVTVLGQLAQALRIDPCELIRVPPRRKVTPVG